jgi:hypothetical protein
MSEPIKIAFDKNVYEFVVDPNKPATISDTVRNEYKRIHELIIQKKITSFISEFLLTYEVFAKNTTEWFHSKEKMRCADAFVEARIISDKL